MRTAILVLTFMPLVYAQSGNAPRPHAIGDWQRMTPAIRKALRSQFPDERGDGPYPVGILRAGHVADITGDGLSEAVVFFGQGGASTSQLTLMRVEGGKPVVALFKDRAGKVRPMIFIEGASVMHTDGVELLPKQRSIFALHYDYGPNGRLHQCGGEAYTWNRQSKTFNHNSPLTKALTKSTCSQVPQRAR